LQTQHRLPELPYDYAALEPHIDAQTMRLHHQMHHASYVANLNKAISDYPELHERSALWLLLNLNAVPAKVRTTVRRNAGGHVNHGLSWKSMSPTGGGRPEGPLGDAIRRSFGSFDVFRRRFMRAGEGIFGSGSVWLARSRHDDGNLTIYATPGHDHPTMKGRLPLLLNDVWEHAYYLRYENRRSDYLENWWKVVNWGEANRRFESSDHSAERDWEDEGGRVTDRHSFDKVREMR
jgi:Fe-Mn family superoxide dismutase